MYAADRDALICDMAEIYHIYDVWSIPVSLFATLACGLRSNSRIKMRMAGYSYIPPEVGLFAIHDILAQVFAKEESAPVSLIGMRYGEEEKKSKYSGFDTTEEFDEWRRGMIGGAGNG